MNKKNIVSSNVFFIVCAVVLTVLPVLSAVSQDEKMSIGEVIKLGKTLDDDALFESAVKKIIARDRLMIDTNEQNLDGMVNDIENVSVKKMLSIEVTKERYPQLADTLPSIVDISAESIDPPIPLKALLSEKQLKMFKNSILNAQNSLRNLKGESTNLFDSFKEHNANHNEVKLKDFIDTSLNSMLEENAKTIETEILKLNETCETCKNMGSIAKIALTDSDKNTINETKKHLLQSVAAIKDGMVDMAEKDEANTSNDEFLNVKNSYIELFRQHKNYDDLKTKKPRMETVKDWEEGYYQANRAAGEFQARLGSSLINVGDTDDPVPQIGLRFYSKNFLQDVTTLGFDPHINDIHLDSISDLEFSGVPNSDMNTLDIKGTNGVSYTQTLFFGYDLDRRFHVNLKPLNFSGNYVLQAGPVVKPRIVLFTDDETNRTGDIATSLYGGLRFAFMPYATSLDSQLGPDLLLDFTVGSDETIDANGVRYEIATEFAFFQNENSKFFAKGGYNFGDDASDAGDYFNLGLFYEISSDGVLKIFGGGDGS